MTVSPILNGWVVAMSAPEIIFESVDWAARPITIEAKPAATNKEDTNPLVPGKAVKVVEATPNKVIAATTTLPMKIYVVFNLGSSRIFLWVCFVRKLCTMRAIIKVIIMPDRKIMRDCRFSCIIWNIFSSTNYRPEYYYIDSM